MRGFSKAIIAGNFTRDPDLRSTPGGSSVCSFSIAVNRVYRDQSGANKEEVSFIDCSAWGKLGEMIASYAKKGTGAIISGRLYQHSWEDKNGGGRRSHVEIVVEDFNFVNSGDRDGGSSYNAQPTPISASTSTASAPAASAAADTSSSVPDDIPEEIDLSEVPF